MESITIELDDEHYHRYKYISNDLGKTVEEHAKQQLENIADTFYEAVREKKRLKLDGDGRKVENKELENGD